MADEDLTLLPLDTIQQRRNEAYLESRRILDEHLKDGRALSPEDETKVKDLTKLVTTYRTEIDRRDGIKAKNEALAKTLDSLAPVEGRTNPDDKPQRRTTSDPANEDRKKPRTWKRSRPMSEAEARRATPAYEALFGTAILEGRNSPAFAELAVEARSLSADLAAEGGFLVLPTMISDQIIQALSNDVHLREYATIHTLTAPVNLGIPTIDAGLSDATWTSEIQTVTADTAMKLGGRSLNPTCAAKFIPVSNKLLMVSAMDVGAILADAFELTYADTQDKAFMTGTGVDEPLGVFTATSQGIPTSRDYSTGNTATAFTHDGLLGAFYTLKPGHQRNATWVFHSDAVSRLAMLKDGSSRPLWQPSLILGQPDMFHGRPLIQSTFAPNTFTASQYVGIVGNFRYYHIAEVPSMAVKRLNELLALSNQTGFLAHYWADGMPVLGEAFARIQLSA